MKNNIFRIPLSSVLLVVYGKIVTGSLQTTSSYTLWFRLLNKELFLQQVTVLNLVRI